MSFYKEVDQALREQAPDTATAEYWLKQADRHFKGELMLLELPAQVCMIITGVEEMYAMGMEDLNTKHREECYYECE